MRLHVTAFLACMSASTGAKAMLSADFLDRFNDQERAAYAGGIVDSMAYGFAAAKQESKAVCVNNWFYRGQGPQQLASVLQAHRDLPVPGVLQVLVKRLCGE
jgi:hypothetical protein